MPSFSYPFAFALSGGVDPTETDLAPVEHVATGMSRVIQQYQGSPALKELIAIYLEEIDELELAAQEVLLAFDINGAEGVNLDAVGAEVGQLRTGLSDALYRLAIKARIIANWSEGRELDISNVVRELLGVGTALDFTEYEEATALLELEDDPPFAFDPEYMATNFLARTKAAGVRLFVFWRTSPASQTFTCAPGDTVVSDALLGLANDGQTTGGHLAQVIGV